MKPVERWLEAAALAVGRTISTGLAAFPRVVARASGLERPSLPACLAGAVGGASVLARSTLGPVAGICVEATGTATVLAIATWRVHADADAHAFRSTLDDRIAEAERLDLCTPFVAALWRAATVGHAALPRRALEIAAVRRGASAVVGHMPVARYFVRGVEIAATPIEVWRGIGAAARLVDGERRSSVALAPRPDDA